MGEFCQKHCAPCEQGAQPLSPEQLQSFVEQISDDWQLNADNSAISRKFSFKGYGKTMAFVNAVAWIASQEMHHPDLEVSYNFCVVNFTTHAAGGLTENDFICAAKVDALLA